MTINKSFFFILTLSLSFFLAVAPLSVSAGGKKANTAQKAATKQNVKNYKKNQRPGLNATKKNATSERKLAQNNLKKSTQSLANAHKTELKFSKARNASKSALMKQKLSVLKAVDNAKLNPTKKNIQTANNMTSRYEKAATDYKNGPKKNWQKQKDKLNIAHKNYQNSKINYDNSTQKLIDATQAKIAAKRRLSGVDVEQSLQNANASTNNIYGKLTLKPKTEPELSQYARAPRLYDRVPPQSIYTKAPVRANNAVYDRVTDSQMNNYTRPPAMIYQSIDSALTQ